MQAMRLAAREADWISAAINSNIPLLSQKPGVLLTSWKLPSLPAPHQSITESYQSSSGHFSCICLLLSTSPAPIQRPPPPLLPGQQNNLLPGFLQHSCLLLIECPYCGQKDLQNMNLTILQLCLKPFVGFPLPLEQSLPSLSWLMSLHDLPSASALLSRLIGGHRQGPSRCSSHTDASVLPSSCPPCPSPHRPD